MNTKAACKNCGHSVNDLTLRPCPCADRKCVMKVCDSCWRRINKSTTDCEKARSADG